MRELIEMFKIVQPISENIKVAKGKYEFTGSILKDAAKILRNGN